MAGLDLAHIAKVLDVCSSLDGPAGDGDAAVFGRQWVDLYRRHVTSLLAEVERLRGENEPRQICGCSEPDWCTRNGTRFTRGSDHA